jgi:hypothetical protein
MKISANVAVATAMTVMAIPAQAGGGARPQAHGAPMHQPQVHQGMQHSGPPRGMAPHGAGTVSGQGHTFYGGPRLERRPDPNYQNPYRPMYSLGATNPGEPHPYFRTPKGGFGYPAAGPSAVYQGNGVYFIPR